MKRCPHVLRARWLKGRRVECLDCHLDRRARAERFRARWWRRLIWLTAPFSWRVLIWLAVPFAAFTLGAIIRVLMTAVRRYFT